MNYETETNRVYLQGIVDDEPVLNHNVKEEEFYSFNLRVARLSGQYDIIPVLMSKKHVVINDIKQGCKLALKGQFRSYNKVENEHRRLILSVFAKEICEWDDALNPNVVELDGYICKPVIFRTTPFSREICDILLAVNRNFNKSDYIPCIAWGANAQFVSALDVATPLKIVGRIQSRDYNKNTGLEVVTKTAYEVSISKLI